MTPGRVPDEAKDRGAVPAGEPGGGVEAPAGAARGASRAGAGARARLALQPRRAAAGGGVPRVAGVVRTVLGGEPGEAEGWKGTSADSRDSFGINMEFNAADFRADQPSVSGRSRAHFQFAG